MTAQFPNFPNIRFALFNNVIVRTAALTVFVALLFCVVPAAFSADTTGQEIGKKLDDAGKAIKEYSAEHRDEALARAKKALAEADARIDEFENNVNKKWDSMNASARQRAQESLRTMRQRRLELAENYGELKRSSSKAWEEVKGGFVKSYDALRDAFSKAAKDF
jgi:F0F1-type ATP synthase membrane subunit b/b'